jgi:tetratricopeptide (TPR) repeat protein
VPARVVYLEDMEDVAVLALADVPVPVQGAALAEEPPARGDVLVRWGRTTGYRSGGFRASGAPFHAAEMLTRSGDSGGPILDAQGRLVGIASRASGGGPDEGNRTWFTPAAVVGKALAAARDAAPLGKDVVCAEGRLVWEHLSESNRRWRADDLEGAHRSLGFALQLADQEDFRRYLLRRRAWLNYERADLPAAEADVDAVLAADPEARSPLGLKAMLLGHRGEALQAIGLLDGWQQRNGSDRWMRSTATWLAEGGATELPQPRVRIDPDPRLQARCAAELATGDDAFVATCRDQALLARDGTGVDRRLFAALGQLYSQRGATEQALQVWEAAAVLDPDGGPEGALERFDTLRHRGGSNPLFLYLDAAALALGGDRELALAQLDYAIEQIPDFAHAQALRAHLAAGGAIASVGIDGTVDLEPLP